MRSCSGASAARLKDCSRRSTRASSRRGERARISTWVVAWSGAGQSPSSTSRCSCRSPSAWPTSSPACEGGGCRSGRRFGATSAGSVSGSSWAPSSCSSPSPARGPAATGRRSTPRQRRRPTGRGSRSRCSPSSSRPAGSSPEAASFLTGRWSRRTSVAGMAVALAALAVIALVLIGTNPHALLFVLPSAHAWLWLVQARDRDARLRGLLYVAGLAGPLLVLGSMALRFGLGLDAPWYLGELTALGYVSGLHLHSRARVGRCGRPGARRHERPLRAVPVGRGSPRPRRCR